MTDNSENRRDARYTFSEYLKNKFQADVYIEFNMDTQVKAEIVDISMNGAGFEIKDTDEQILKDIKGIPDFFIKLFLPGKTILCEVKKIWDTFSHANESVILKGGIVFRIMSPDDRLHLAEFIKEIRNRF